MNHHQSDDKLDDAAFQMPPERDDLSSQLEKVAIEARLFGAPARPIKIGHFTLLERIAGGGMGEVFSAYDQRLDRKVAIKLLRARNSLGAVGAERLLREAQVLATLSHPNVVQVFEAGTFEGKPFIAMEYIDGPTLRAWLHEVRASARTREILGLFRQIGLALQSLHDAGIIHRDFKPENILIDKVGQPRIVDFGLARLRYEDAVPSDAQVERSPASGLNSGSVPDVYRSRAAMPLTETGAIIGTPLYMAPEQLRGEAVDNRSDQFSFCVTLYECLYQQRPFEADSIEGFETQVRNGQISKSPPSSRVPAAVRKALVRGLSYDPAARFSDMNELLKALGAWRFRIWHYVAGAGIAMTSTALALLIASSKWTAAVGGVVGLGGLVALLVLRGSARNFYERLVSIVVSAGLIANASGFAVDAFFVSNPLSAETRWNGAPSVVFFLAWAIIVGVLLFVNYSIRATVASATQKSQGSPDKVKILFLAANPIAVHRLDVDREYRRVSLALRRSSRRRQVEIRYWPDVHLKDLPSELRRYKPAVIHFSGHGDDGHVVLLDAVGEPKPIGIKTIVDLLGRSAATLKLVVLNACHSGDLAEALVRRIPCVISATGSVSDKRAALFAEILYEALWDGENIADAFHDARTIIAAEAPEEGGEFVLFVARGIDAHGVRFVDSPNSRGIANASV